MNEEKIYVGSGKKHAEYDIVNVSVCLSDLPKEHMFEYQGKQYIKLTVAAKKETDQYGKTHYVAVDTWKPEEKAEPQATDTQQGTDGLPF